MQKSTLTNQDLNVSKNGKRILNLNAHHMRTDIMFQLIKQIIIWVGYKSLTGKNYLGVVWVGAGFRSVRINKFGVHAIFPFTNKSSSCRFVPNKCFSWTEKFFD